MIVEDLCLHRVDQADLPGTILLKVRRDFLSVTFITHQRRSILLEISASLEISPAAGGPKLLQPGAEAPGTKHIFCPSPLGRQAFSR